MSYIDILQKSFQKRNKSKHTILDIYSGAGGLSLGLEYAGFKVSGIDNDKDSVNSYNYNLQGKCIHDTITPKYDFPNVDILVGGPPCQPFSVRGKQKGEKDTRNGIPSFISAIQKIKPKLFLFENVRGFYKYSKSFVSTLEKLGYVIDISIINCSHYGIPQNRERVIIVGHDGTYIQPPKSDYIATVGDAIKNIPQREKPFYLTPNMDKYILAYEKASQCRPRDLDFSKPARTLTCRNLGGYSSDMIRISRNKKRRILFVREAARLQSFPDWFEFVGSRYSKMKQVGNAVPPLLALSLGVQIQKYMKGK